MDVLGVRWAEPVAPVGSSSSAFPAAPPVDEATWSAWASGLQPVVAEGRRVVVVAPHPDDETLGCGGLLHDLAGRSIEVQVVTATNGEGSHRHWPGLAAVRRAEQVEALRSLGVSAEPIFLDLPDGAVSDHVGDLETALAELVAGADVVVAPWASDGHADHDAVGQVAVEVGSRMGVTVLAHPVWAWQWATLDELEGPPWKRWDLPPAARRAKADALARHRSQTSEVHGPAVLGGEVLARAGRSWEVYARVG